MPVIERTAGEVHQVHGSTFRSVVRGAQLCAWQLTVPAGLAGAPHRPDREEVLLIQEGELHVTLDGVTAAAGVGDVVVVPAGTELTIDGGGTDATAWVTTTRGLTAGLADGSTIAPPWAN